MNHHLDHVSLIMRLRNQPHAPIPKASTSAQHVTCQRRTYPSSVHELLAHGLRTWGTSFACESEFFNPFNLCLTIFYFDCDIDLNFT